MEIQENNGSIPRFGGWDQGAGGPTNYSVVFSRARANRKQQKRGINRHSIGSEKELSVKQQREEQQEDPIIRKKKFLTYLNCCIRP